MFMNVVGCYNQKNSHIQNREWSAIGKLPDKVIFLMLTHPGERNLTGSQKTQVLVLTVPLNNCELEKSA